MALLDFPDLNTLHPQSIALGFIDGIGKNSASGLQSAIQQAQSDSEARNKSIMQFMSQRQEGLRAAEENARNMLLQRSSAIGDKINELSSSYDYSLNPSKYQSQISELMRQKGEVDSQLAASTEKIRTNPMYKGETLVEPASARAVTYQNGETEAVHAFLENLLGGMQEEDLSKKSSQSAWDEFQRKNPGSQMAKKDFNDAFDSNKKEFLLAQEQKRAIALSKSKHKNDLSEQQNRELDLAARNLELNAQLKQTIASSKTQAELEKMLEGTMFREWAKTQGLDHTTLKQAAIKLYDTLKSKKSRGNVEDL